MYEEDLDISTTLNTFMNNNNLSIRSLAKLINSSEKTVSSWLSNKKPISRQSYNQLKELGVFTLVYSFYSLKQQQKAYVP